MHFWLFFRQTNKLGVYTPHRDVYSARHSGSVAERLKDNKRIQWIFIGDGRKKKWVQQFVQSREMEDTVHLYKRYPIEYMSAFFKKADIMLLSLCNNNAFNVTLPAKLQAYMLNAKPVLVMANGEAQSVVREARCGYGANADSIDKMEGIEFERFCARLLAANGYENVEVTSCSGDQGVDILCEKDRVSYAVQCKRFDSLVGNGAVQEVYAGRQLYHCNVGVVMTNSDFTPSARELAEATGVALWGRDVVLKMAGAMRDSGL